MSYNLKAAMRRSVCFCVASVILQGFAGPVRANAQTAQPANQPLTAAQQMRPVTSSLKPDRIADWLKNHQLKMDDAVGIALIANREIASSVSGLMKAQGRTLEAKSALNPTANLEAAITEFDAGTSVALGGNSFLELNQFNPVFMTAASLPLDIKGNLRTAVSQSQFEEAAAKIEVSRVMNSVVLDVKSGFYEVLRGQAQLNAARDALNNAATRAEMAQKSFKAGVSPSFDVIRAQTDIANAQQGAILARTNLKIAMALLKSTMGVDVSLPIRVSAEGAVEAPVAGTPSLSEPVNVPSRGPVKAPVEVSSLAPGEVNEPIELGPEYGTAVTEALAKRPEILEAQAHIAAANRGIKLARAARDPFLSLNLGYTLTPNNTIFNRENVVAATLNINVPLYDGGLSRSREIQAKAILSGLETSLSSARDMVALDVQRSYLALVQSKSRITASEAGMNQAREAARLARVRYASGVAQQAGVSPLLELSDTENALAQAELSEVNALYDYNVARTQLDRAVGRYASIINGQLNQKSAGNHKNTGKQQ